MSSLQPDLWIGTICDSFQSSRNDPDDNDLLNINKRGNEMFIAQFLRKKFAIPCKSREVLSSMANRADSTSKRPKFRGDILKTGFELNKSDNKVEESELE